VAGLTCFESSRRLSRHLVQEAMLDCATTNRQLGASATSQVCPRCHTVAVPGSTESASLVVTGTGRARSRVRAVARVCLACGARRVARDRTGGKWDRERRQKRGKRSATTVTPADTPSKTQLGKEGGAQQPFTPLVASVSGAKAAMKKTPTLKTLSAKKREEEEKARTPQKRAPGTLATQPDSFQGSLYDLLGKL
jgi:hypothetical protein